MPAKMISEIPLPMPRAVICSPSHIRNMVPPTRVITVAMRKNQPGSVTMSIARFEADGDAVSLYGAQQHSSVTGVLVDDLAALLTLFLELLKRGHNRSHQLNDDRSGNVRHDAEREDRHALNSTTRKHVKESKNAACLALEGLCECIGVDAGQRNVGSQAVNQKRAKGKPDPFLEVFRLGESSEKFRLEASCSAADAIAFSAWPIRRLMNPIISGGSELVSPDDAARPSVRYLAPAPAVAT